MDNKILIGIMTNKKPRQKQLKRFISFNKNPNVELFAFTPSGINWQEEKISGLTVSKGETITKEFPFPNSVINLIYTKQQQTIAKLEEKLGGKKVFNTVNRLDKWQTYETLSESPVAFFLPDTFMFKEKEFLPLLKRYKVLYLKPRHGLKGVLIYRVEWKEEAGQYNIYDHSSTPVFVFNDEKLCLTKIKEIAGKKKYIVQKEIKSAAVNESIFDIRVIIHKNRLGKWEVSGGLARIAIPRVYVTNAALKMLPLEDLLKRLNMGFLQRAVFKKKLELISIASAKALEEEAGQFGELSADFMIDDRNQLFMLEINGQPTKKVRDPDLLEKMYTKPLDFACYLAEN
ncbi:YheC/YheD family protein [Salipaludibacillus aurantiacus]|uniref:YheC/D like ATP-grasp n=1 Tax=Salipaludibacillus aurantiacus TaxID=1601833 RepID=A0A1H9TCW8_9BACI|nr:YheC/YheD family protein [Salipaludibacillus aurantiacus]SER94956.1 YheC/D like ATP-grasp [Salipaludibacillus aurantiacus]